jgi:glycosyltransferase involved in cell wall biosynthesis
MKVSVVMPAYNAEKYIAAAIESVLSQTFKDFELLVVDDGSTDRTQPIIDQYRRADERVVLLKNDQNLRLAKTLNRGIEAARGKYVARMDADDISLPERLEKQIDFLEKNSEVSIVGGTMEVVDEAGGKRGERRYWESDEEIRKRIFLFSPFCHPAIMIRKAVLEKSGLYDPDYNPAEDYEFYLRVGIHSKFANLADPLIKYRVISGSMTTSRLKEMELKTIKARKKFFDSPAYQATKRDRVYNSLHYFSVTVPLIPPKQKIWLFGKIRSLVR